jgi:hypothetical protein
MDKTHGAPRLAPLTRRASYAPAGLSSHLNDALLRDAAEALLAKLDGTAKKGKAAEARIYVQVGLDVGCAWLTMPVMIGWLAAGAGARAWWAFSRARRPPCVGGCGHDWLPCGRCRGACMVGVFQGAGSTLRGRLGSGRKGTSERRRLRVPLVRHPAPLGFCSAVLRAFS